MYVLSGNLTSTSDHYINNSAVIGGAIYMVSGSCNLCNDSFTINTAGEGAAIYKDGGILKICQTNITNNFASNKGTLILKSVTLTFPAASMTRCLLGRAFVTRVLVPSTALTLLGLCLSLAVVIVPLRALIAKEVNFMNNQDSLYVSFTQVQINRGAVFMNNSGDFGGAITIIQHNMYGYHQ